MWTQGNSIVSRCEGILIEFRGRFDGVYFFFPNPNKYSFWNGHWDLKWAGRSVLVINFSSYSTVETVIIDRHTYTKTYCRQSHHIHYYQICVLRRLAAGVPKTVQLGTLLGPYIQQAMSRICGGIFRSKLFLETSRFNFNTYFPSLYKTVVLILENILTIVLYTLEENLHTAALEASFCCHFEVLILGFWGRQLMSESPISLSRCGMNHSVR